jgi:hypothetical protein
VYAQAVQADRQKVPLASVYKEVQRRIYGPAGFHRCRGSGNIWNTKTTGENINQKTPVWSHMAAEVTGLRIWRLPRRAG